MEDPLDADTWIRTIESKFSLLVVPCSDANKAHFAAQQLRGTGCLWWDNYFAMLPVDHVVAWDEFKYAFRAHHIPEGLMERKLNEFLALTQGTRTILQYAQVSITFFSMWAITLTPMLRSLIASKALVPNSRIA
jgi:hypothetical protein